MYAAMDEAMDGTLDSDESAADAGWEQAGALFDFSAALDGTGERWDEVEAAAADEEGWAARERADAGADTDGAAQGEGADHPATQAELEILARMMGRPGGGPVLSHDRGVFLGPELKAQPDNRARAMPRSDGAYRSARGSHGINLEVETTGRGSNPSQRSTAELAKHAAAMRAALQRTGARAGSTAQRTAALQDMARRIQRTATVVVEVDPRRPTHINRLWQQTYSVRNGAVTAHRRRLPLPAAGVSVEQAFRSGLLDRIRGAGRGAQPGSRR